MSRNIRGPVAAAGIMVGLALAVVAGVVAFHSYSHRPRETTLNQTPAEEQKNTAKQKRAETLPATRAVTPKAEAKKPDASYMDVVRTTYPAFPTTQPLASPLDLSQAARLVLNEPIYLSRIRGDLWITRSDAPPINRVLHEAIDPNAVDPQSHIIDRRVEFVHWMPTDSGNWLPYLVCPTADHKDEVIWEHGQAQLPTPRDFQWDRAFSVDEDVVVPSGSGLSVLHFGQPITESYFQLVAGADATTGPSLGGKVQVLRDSKGLLAWMPWEHGTGSRGAVRYVKGTWTPLGPDQGWPERIAYLVPLLDGTVFQFVSDEKGSITIQSTALDTPDVDEPAVRKLVSELSDVDQDVRKAAYTKLSNFGPRTWPLLEKLGETQSPQAKLMIGQLLKDKNRPTLSGMTLLGKRELTLNSRLSDGGVVLYAEQGVSIPESEDQSTTIAPAWLSVRPGHYIELLSPALVNDLKPEETKFEVVADQWTVNNDVRGPRLFYGNGLATLLRKEDQAFTQIMGMDQMGRWFFRKGDDHTGAGPTLIIDPHLPDPTPRLPVWQLAIAETVGWDKDNWPALKNGAIYAITATDWRAIEKEEDFLSQPDPGPSTAPPSTAPSTEPAADAPLCKTHDGAVIYDGLTELRITEPDGKRTTWSLPDIANGVGPATLIEAPDGRLFLFNQPGRVLRIARTSHEAEPFKLEATFTHNIPSVAKPTRIWLDPAGRINIAWGGRLAILFPAGYIPQQIMQKIADRSGLDADGL